MSNYDIIEQEIKALESRSIDYSTAEKLAWLYIVRDHLKLSVSGDTDFLKAVQGKDINTVLSVVDELMTILQAVQPGLYDGVMRKLNQI